MKAFAILLLLALLHTIPLWDTQNKVAGSWGDPFAHAAIGEWFCRDVMTGNFKTDIFLAPYGANLAGNYESAFPFLFTCAIYPAGPIAQFHLFIFLQICLILFSSLLVARLFLKNHLLQFAYVLFIWWSGYYVARSHQHMTLLSNIWGIQFTLYAFFSLHLQNRKSALISAGLFALSLVGTFQNMPTLLPFAIGCFFLRIFEIKQQLDFRPAKINLGLALFTFAAIFAFFWGPMVLFTLKRGVPALGDQRYFYNLDLLSAVIPFETNRIYSWIQSSFRLAFERYNQFDFLMLFLALGSACGSSFWRERRKVLFFSYAIAYYVLALGPELRIVNDVSISLPLNQEIFGIFPFSITRTPARLAVLTQGLITLLAFLFLDQLKKDSWKKPLAYSLIAWIAFTGPYMNQLHFFPTMKYREIFAMQGLESIKSLPQDTIVVQVPLAFAQDPAQNFQRLFHGKNITSGYLAYTVYDQDVIANFSQDQLLGHLDCNQASFNATSFAPESFAQLRTYLQSRKMTAFIFNKNFLLGQPSCQGLLAWLRELAKQPWFKVTQETQSFITAEVR